MKKNNKLFGWGIVPCAMCLIMTLVPSGCSSDDNLKMRDILKFREEFQDSVELSDIDNVTRVLFDVEVGDLNVSYHNSNTAIVKVNYRAGATNKSDLEIIVEETKISLKANEEALKLRINKKDSEESIWEWLDKKISKYNISADVQIFLPKQMQDFDIKTGLGDIEVDGLQGAFKLNSHVGDITARNVRFTGNSTVVADKVGSVNLSLVKEEPDESEVEISTGNGNITIDVGDLSYEEEEISGSFSASKSSKAIVISNKCIIKASTDMMGEVVVE